MRLVKEAAVAGLPESPIVQRRKLAQELRRLREAAGLAEETVGRALSWSSSKISRYETAMSPPRISEVFKLLDYYQITGQRRTYLLDLARSGCSRAWWEMYKEVLPSDYARAIGLEQGADSILTWQQATVPPLLQTGAYAQCLIDSYGQVDPIPPIHAKRQVDVRVLHQQMLNRVTPPALHVVLDEAVLRHRVGDARTMRGQMERLAEERPGITVQVLPAHSHWPGSAASFTLLSFGTDDDISLPDVVVVEYLTGLQFVEDDRETHLHRIAFQKLTGAALDPVASRALIKEVAGLFAS